MTFDESALTIIKKETLMKRIALNISIVIASVCIAVFFANAAISATYYVSPSGSDSNAGSLSAPFKTL